MTNRSKGQVKFGDRIFMNMIEQAAALSHFLSLKPPDSPLSIFLVFPGRRQIWSTAGCQIRSFQHRQTPICAGPLQAPLFLSSLWIFAFFVSAGALLRHITLTYLH